MSGFKLLWLQSGGCGGCSMSVLNAETPDFIQALKQNGIDLLWHPSISEASGDEFHELLDQIENGDLQLDALCLEGSVIMGPSGSGRFHKLSGRERPMFDVIHSLSSRARYTVAIGSCAVPGLCQPVQ